MTASLLTFPALDQLAKEFPDAQIDIVSLTKTASFFEILSCIHSIIKLEEYNYKALKTVFQDGYDLFISFCGRPGLSALAKRYKIPHRIGYPETAFLQRHLTVRLKNPSQSTHLMMRHQQLLEPLLYHLQTTEPVMECPDDLLNSARKTLKNCLNPKKKTVFVYINRDLLRVSMEVLDAFVQANSQAFSFVIYDPNHDLFPISSTLRQTLHIDEPLPTKNIIGLMAASYAYLGPLSWHAQVAGLLKKPCLFLLDPAVKYPERAAPLAAHCAYLSLYQLKMDPLCLKDAFSSLLMQTQLDGPLTLPAKMQRLSRHSKRILYILDSKRTYKTNAQVFETTQLEGLQIYPYFLAGHTFADMVQCVSFIAQKEIDLIQSDAVLPMGLPLLWKCTYPFKPFPKNVVLPITALKKTSEYAPFSEG